MSVTQVKGLTWLASVALFLYMFLFAWNFELGLPQWAYEYLPFLEVADTKAELRKGPSKEEQSEVLGGVEPPPADADDLVEYEAVLAAFVEQDFSGQPPPAVQEEEEAEEEETAPPVTPVADILRVIFIRYDSSSEEGSVAIVKYIAPELARVPADDARLRVGDALPAPHGHVHVASIEPGLVVFGFDDEDREPESLATDIVGEDVSYIARVGEGEEALTPIAETRIPSATLPPYRPRKTTPIRPNHFIIGGDDAEEIGRNWQEILSREVRSTRHRDPRTGRYDGIEITSIRPGSVASRHGVQSGDVLKSINGTPVTSKSEAITFVKNNDDVYDTWEVVIERLGREVTMTYEEPPPSN